MHYKHITANTKQQPFSCLLILVTVMVNPTNLPHCMYSCSTGVSAHPSGRVLTLHTVLHVVVQQELLCLTLIAIVVCPKCSFGSNVPCGHGVLLNLHLLSKIKRTMLGPACLLNESTQQKLTRKVHIGCLGQGLKQTRSSKMQFMQYIDLELISHQTLLIEYKSCEK
jgi:hypothetical protein